MATVAKPRKPVADATKVAQLAAASTGVALNADEENMTVEQFLEKQFEEMVKEFRTHTTGLITKLRNEYQEGAAQLTLLMNNHAAPSPLCVILKCTSGPHSGQKFRLEGSSGEDIFRMGRSTGKAFKEKGVSLYKDKEISTTHAKIELRYGQAFLIDADSTNGTLLNGEDVPSLTPYRLKEGDVITMGSTELSVDLSTIDQENVSSST